MLFPNSCIPTSASSSHAAPSDAQTRQSKQQCATNLLSLLPVRLRDRYLGTGTKADEGAALADVEHELDIWGDAYLNKHVAYGVLELVLVRLLPELAEEKVSELLAARIG